MTSSRQFNSASYAVQHYMAAKQLRRSVCETALVKTFKNTQYSTCLHAVRCKSFFIALEICWIQTTPPCPRYLAPEGGG